MSQGHAGVAEPLLVGLDVVDEDDEVVRVALVVDLALGGLAASHCGPGASVLRVMMVSRDVLRHPVQVLLWEEGKCVWECDARRSL